MNSKEFARLEEELERNEIDAARWRKLCELAFNGEAFRAIAIAPAGATQEEITLQLNDWIDRVKVKQ